MTAEGEVPEGGRLAPDRLAELDQFHAGRLPATLDLIRDAGLRAGERVLDLGCGLGGPARVMAATSGATVTGLDLSEAFIATGRYLTERCGLGERVSLAVGDATRTGFADGAFDAVVLQHVGMNVADRGALYREAARVLRPGGRLVLVEVAQGAGELVFPVTWARDPAMSHLLTPEAMRAAVEGAGLRVERVRYDTERVLLWAAERLLMRPRPGPGLVMAMGHDVAAMEDNLLMNLRAGCAHVITIVARKDAEETTGSGA